MEDYTTSRVLTMDYLRGRKVTEISPLARLEIDGGGLAEELGLSADALAALRDRGVIT